MKKNNITLDAVLACLPGFYNFHSRSTELYRTLSKVTEEAVDGIFGETGLNEFNSSTIGSVKLPYVAMGSINTTHLWGLDELIIFSFYQRNVGRYKRVADIGANVGLHSIVLAKLGYMVTAFEPDPKHYEILRENLSLNTVTNFVDAVNAAVSISDGRQEFTRVVGNTTGSHLSGAKDNPYGELERFEVDVREFKKILSNVDFAKIDVEGHEADLIVSTQKDDWINFDTILEIGSERNARKIFAHLTEIGVNVFSQKISWGRVVDIDQMPTSYREGSAFCSLKEEMFWGEG
jgi:FkbM family methyltransferase